MESVLGRYRNLIVLVGVLFAQVLGLAVQVKRPTDSGSTHLIRIWAVGAVTPLEKALVWAQTSTGNLWHNYIFLRGVRAENRALKQEIERMRLEQVRMTQDAGQAHRLQALLAFKEQFVSQTLAAQVIGSAGSELSRSVYIDKGRNDGLKRDMAVVTKDGIVGKVLYVYPSTSLVLLIDDQTSGVGAILDKERLQGILRGTASGEVALEKVMSDETVPVGEDVLTSGGDGIFPKGLPVGKVTKVSPGNELFLDVRVRPAVDLSRLEEVLVVTKIDERQAQADQSGPVRAADILAERLPTVPSKPENAADTAGKNPVAPAGGTASTPAPKAGVPPEGVPKSTTPTAGAPRAVTPGGTAERPATPGAGVSGGSVRGTGLPKSAIPNTANVGASSGGSPNAGTAHAPAPGSTPIVKKAVASVPSSPSVSPTGPAASSAAKKPAPNAAAPAVPPNPQPAAQDAPH